MLLKNLIRGIPKYGSNIFISGIATNSKEVKKNYIFFAIRGNKLNGEIFIKDAIKIGDISKLPDIIKIIEETQSISKVQIKSEEQLNNIKTILDKMPNNDFKKIILNLAEYCVYRKN